VCPTDPLFLFFTNYTFILIPTIQQNRLDWPLLFMLDLGFDHFITVTGVVVYFLSRRRRETLKIMTFLPLMLERPTQPTTKPVRSALADT
jgi:hypothetical protein